MDAVKFIKERMRMCKSNGDCRSCELYDFKNNADMDCDTYIDEYPEQAVAIVEKWSQEHPRKTFLSDFLEKYPNAKLLKNGTPENICPEDLGYCDKVDECKPLTDDCAVCWNRPLEE